MTTAPSETDYAPDPTDGTDTGEPPPPVDHPEENGVTHAGIAVWALDTGRILMQQRSFDPTDAPDVQGTWEFPGGGVEDGETTFQGACREFCEETGLELPDGNVVNEWISENGVYHGFVLAVPVETEAFGAINPDTEAAEYVNPDDPERTEPDVTAWFTVDQIKNLGPALRPEVAKTDWTLFEQGADMPDPAEKTGAMRVEGQSWAQVLEQHLAAPPMYKVLPREKKPKETAPKQRPLKEKLPPVRPPHMADQSVPFHSVLAVENKKTGDGRRFMPNSLSHRPLPLPYTWQKVADEQHKGNVVVAKIEKIKMGEITTDDGETLRAQLASGHMLNNAEANEFMALLAEFGRFGTSIDADSAVMELNDAEDTVDFSEARTSSACAVPIPALAEAWISLGEAPAEWGMEEPDEAATPESLVASFTINEPAMAALLTSLTDEFKDLAPGRTEDGPGWLTHPVDTNRLRDYWTKGPGAARIGWGTPGDFNRCRAELAEFVVPEHLSGYCANRHFDALGFWPGRPVSGETVPFAADSLGLSETAAAPAISLVAAAGPIKAPAAWFANPGFEMGDPRLVEFEPGKWACPFTVTEDGHVFGHIAARGTCHIGPQFDYCVEPPFSETEYAYFRTGAVLLDNGTEAATGVLSIGGGHAGEHLNARQTLAHYDRTSTAAADVGMWDDEFGIAVNGWIRPGVSPEMVTALRASKISGDWRPWGPHPLELVAALAVNVPGFGVPRVQIAAGIEGQQSLVAAGMFPSTPEQAKAHAALDIGELAYSIAVQMAEFEDRRRQIAALAARTEES